MKYSGSEETEIMSINRFVITLFLLLFCCIGCVTREATVISFAPVKPFESQSGQELLAEFNSHLPFTVKPGDFLCERKADGLVGWVIVQSNFRKDVVKKILKDTPTLQLLQVEKLTPDVETLFKRQG
jgi:hypothetical protein